MKEFIGQDFLLENSTEVYLYENYSKSKPIIDYHNHLSPKEIYENNNYETITDIWLNEDHYKWRVMRLNGVEEKYITGNASKKDKFMAWAKTVQRLIGNPLYHWTHMELKEYFNIRQPLDEESAEDIWLTCNEMLKEENMTPKGLIESSNVQVIGTTDDPTDDLYYHKQIYNSPDFKFSVIPTFRPDGALKIQSEDFISWIEKLSMKTSVSIINIDDLLSGLKNRMKYFKDHGCVASDHDLINIPFKYASKREVNDILSKRLAGYDLTNDEVDIYQTYLLIWLGGAYYEMGWVMQYHMGVLRNNNTKAFLSIGKDSGFDSIGESSMVYSLSRIFDQLEKNNQLPKTILYSVNPKDTYTLGTMMGNFTEAGIQGKIQLGSAWWFNDHIDGMTDQLKATANLGLLSNFVGMLTDSRSFLSFQRHDYFRRIVCHIIGDWIEKGHIPNDMNRWGKIVSDLSYQNANRFFLKK